MVSKSGIEGFKTLPFVHLPFTQIQRDKRNEGAEEEPRTCAESFIALKPTSIQFLQTLK